MPDIWIRAYGGTGNLISRAFINCMMMAPLKDSGSKITIFLMDYDDTVAGDNDNSILQDLSQYYNALKGMNIPGLAANEINIVTGKLNEVRYNTFNLTLNMPTTFSLQSLFGIQRAELLKYCLTTEQISASNDKGAFGDLARNSMIAKPMESSGAFDNTFQGFNPASDIIAFYLGSTDGGVANTILDRDLNALCQYIQTKGHPLNDKRSYKIYSVRTLPYKKHSTNDPNPDISEIAKRILNQMVAQSKGVIDNINDKPNYVYTGGSPSDYKLDGLFIAGYDVTNSARFNDTNNYNGVAPTAHIQNQSHFSHSVELISALMMIDAINNPNLGLGAGRKAVYAYNSDINPANNNGTLRAQDLFNPEKIDVPVEPDPLNNPPIQLDLGQKFKVAIHLYTFLLQFQKDLTDISNAGRINSANLNKLFKKIYNVGLFKGQVIDFPQIGRIAAKFNNYINAGREFTKFIYEIQKNTLFDSANPVIDILPQDALEKLVENPDNPDFYFSLNSLYIMGDDNSYDEILLCLRNLSVSTLHSIVIDDIKGNLTDDEATAILINIIYQQIYEQLNDR